MIDKTNIFKDKNKTLLNYGYYNIKRKDYIKELKYILFKKLKIPLRYKN